MKFLGNVIEAEPTALSNPYYEGVPENVKAKIEKKAEVAANKMMQLGNSKIKYDNYSDKTHEKTYFDDDSKGFVVTELSRLATAGLNKEEQEKYLKEKAMCVVFAKAGHTIEHLGEVSNISSPDVNFDDIPADLKRTNSHNNMRKYAVHAVREQGAKIVLFQFDIMNRKIFNELKKLRKIGIHGYYFITGYEMDIYRF